MPTNPYPKQPRDEGGIEVSNDLHRVWEEGYKACEEDLLDAIAQWRVSAKLQLERVKEGLSR